MNNEHDDNLQSNRHMAPVPPSKPYEDEQSSGIEATTIYKVGDKTFENIDEAKAYRMELVAEELKHEQYKAIMDKISFHLGSDACTYKTKHSQTMAGNVLKEFFGISTDKQGGKNV